MLAASIGTVLLALAVAVLGLTTLSTRGCGARSGQLFSSGGGLKVEVLEARQRYQ